MLSFLAMALNCGHTESIIGYGNGTLSLVVLKKSLSTRSKDSFVDENSVLTLLASFFVPVTSSSCVTLDRVCFISVRLSHLRTRKNSGPS